MFTRYDFLGSPITFNYKGSQTYDSVVGCLCSVLVTVALSIYLAYAVLSISSSSAEFITAA